MPRPYSSGCFCGALARSELDKFKVFQQFHTLSRRNWNRFGVINSLKDIMEQGFRYEKDCLSKKERATCIGNGNSGENPKRFNVERTRTGL